MAHPSKNLTQESYYVDNAVELVAPEGRHFSITALDGGNVTVKGGVFVQKAAVVMRR